MSDLDFNALLERATAEWPPQFEVVIRPTQNSAGTMRYYVEGLGQLADSIGGAYVGKEDEILMRSLHDALMLRMHALAPDSPSLRPRTLNAMAIKAVFDERLEQALAPPDVGWTDHDRSLVRAYLEANRRYAAAA